MRITSTLFPLLYHRMIFPTLQGKAVCEMNLNEVAIRWRTLHPEKFEGGKNPLFTDPDECQRMVDDFHDRMGVFWSFGDWMKLRDVVWQGSYMEEEQRFLHLGVDCNVPAGTPVAVTMPTRVERIDVDTDMDGGWGTRLILDPLEDQSHLLIYAHLSSNVRVAVGELLSPGEIVGHVGSSKESGGWFPHLHAQWYHRALYKHHLKKGLSALDGYARLSVLEDPERERIIRILYPDPTEMLGLKA